jgi:hypothetical protein
MRYFLVIAIALCACSKKSDSPAAATGRDELLFTWKKAGLQPGTFVAAQAPNVGADCASTTVNNLDVLVCQYGTEAEAKAAEDKGLAWVGDTTGSSQAHGKLLVVAADRKKADPNGKSINQLEKLAGK